MKIFNIIVVIVFFAKSLIAQQEKPEWINITPFLGEDHIDSHFQGDFVSADEGWIIPRGDKYNSNSVYYTNNGGASFSKIFENEDSTISLARIYMFDNLHGHIAGYNWDDIDIQYIFKTNDGGQSWVDVMDTSFFNQFDYIYYDINVHFYNESIGFTSHIKNGIANIYRTSDGAQSWELMQILGYEELGLDRKQIGTAEEFYFLDELHGWALCFYGAINLGLQIVLNTINGGLTWEVIDLISGYNLIDIDFITPEKGGFTSNYTASFTENNFDTISFNYQNWGPEMNQKPYVLDYQNDSIIWISGNPGIIYRSINSGESFEEYVNANMHSIYDIEFFNGKIGYAFGANGILKFIDTLPSKTGILDNSENVFSIYPNPCKHTFNVTFKVKGKSYLSIYKMDGSKIYDYYINNVELFQVDTKGMAKGIYLLVLETENGSKHTNKLIVN